MSLNEQASAQRPHIGFFGLRNAGKSSLVNAVTGQQLSLVSEIKGTTTDPVQKAMELLGTDCSNTVFIGDQLFTDIYGAKRAGIRNILVKPIHPKEEIQIVLKRYLERIVLYFYRKEEGTL